MKKTLMTVVLAILLLTQPAIAMEMYAYPKQGQSAEKQSKDDYECYRWASQRTGYDTRQPRSSPDYTSESTGRGVVGGALLGLAIGEIADGHGGEGAAIGALLGGTRGYSKGRQREQAVAYGERDSYNRAYKACMEARGYSVN